MTHGDDAGLRLPPRVAPVQVILVAVKDAPGVSDVLTQLERELSAMGMRVRVDRRTDVGLGRRLTDWELKGVPVRIEVGPRDLANGQVSLVPRDGSERALVSIESAPASVVDAVQAVEVALYEQAAAHLARRTVDVTDVSSAIEAAQEGFVRLPWKACDGPAEHVLNAAGISVRCVTTPDGKIPEALDADDLMAVAARAY
jgi:prolyl-tRNA synthetase